MNVKVNVLPALTILLSEFT